MWQLSFYPSTPIRNMKIWKPTFCPTQLRGPRPTRPTFKPSRGPTENSEEKRTDQLWNMIYSQTWFLQRRGEICAVSSRSSSLYTFIFIITVSIKSFPVHSAQWRRNIVSTNANKIFLKWTAFMLCFLWTCLVFVLQYSLTSNSSVDGLLRISNNP